MIDGKPRLRLIRLYRWIRRLPLPEQTPAQRAAIARKQAAAIARDWDRFLSATAHMPDSDFIVGANPVLKQLGLGLGRVRRVELAMRWREEPERRSRRTAHQVLAERRLYGGPG